jgi:hypothetical protein
MESLTQGHITSLTLKYNFNIFYFDIEIKLSNLYLKTTMVQPLLNYFHLS